MVLLVALALAVVCGALAVRGSRLLATGLWLAGSSASLACGLYLLDAPYVGAIELSVGAGLVAVLLVFAVAGGAERSARSRPALPRVLALALVALPLAVIVWLIWPPPPFTEPHTLADLAQTMWQNRGLDQLAELVLLCAGVLGVLTLVGGLPASDPHEAEKQEEARA
jgi:NADH:ubiquinone oxidoreductase subunit 6 (subunit J)